MTSFLHPLLLWGLAIVTVPIVIHLINLLRHRRVEWAAMEFLLASQRKNSTWVRLKELLLLLLRMAAVAAVVLIVAQPLGCKGLSQLLGGSKTHHIVLLDDSYSMGDRQADSTAFDKARRVVERIGDEVARQPRAQSFTLLRFSRARPGRAGTQPDLQAEKVTTDFGRRLQELLKPIGPSQLSVGPAGALEAIEQLFGDTKGEDRVVYLVSDFRAKEWDEPDELAAALARLETAKAQLRLINCADGAHANLAISALEPAGGTRAAGVPLYLDVTVTNYGSALVEGVSVLLQEDDQARPALAIDEIPPGESETRRFPVYFASAGDHLVTASLGGDTLAADNVRYCVVDLPGGVPVLLVDGEPDATNARYLAAALAPGGAVKTGIDPRIEPTSFLNVNRLDEFQAIYLLNVDRLDHAAVAALEDYVRSGGGVGLFLGDRCRAVFYNDQLYRDGQGMFPLPLVTKTQLLVDRLEKGADLEVSEHPIFAHFAGERNSYLNAVLIDWYFSAPKLWKAETGSTSQVIARLRNGAPLVVAREFGEGRVVAFMTTAAPQWNNWGRNPSFVVTSLELQAYLAPPDRGQANHTVGAVVERDLDPAHYQPRARLVLPAVAAIAARTPATAGEPPPPSDAGSLTSDAAPVPDSHLVRVSFPEALVAGEYRLELTTTENQSEERRLAFNVDASEGNLATVGGEELATKLKGIHFEYRQADEFHMAAADLADKSLSPWFLYALVGLLLGEQWLAYAASYHPKREAMV